MRGGGDWRGGILGFKRKCIIAKKPTPIGNRGLWVYRQEIALLLMQKRGGGLEQFGFLDLRLPLLPENLRISPFPDYAYLCDRMYSCIAFGILSFLKNNYFTKSVDVFFRRSFCKLKKRCVYCTRPLLLGCPLSPLSPPFAL